MNPTVRKLWVQFFELLGVSPKQVSQNPEPIIDVEGRTITYWEIVRKKDGTPTMRGGAVLKEERKIVIPTNIKNFGVQVVWCS